MLVSIITPTTGHQFLRQAVESVQAQDYNMIEHLVVIDGEERRQQTEITLKGLSYSKKTHFLHLPYITGHSKYKGHRIYGLSSYLANGDFVVFLDEDNWFDPSHISSLVKWVTDHHLDWAYALRKIVNQTGEFITLDDCESLGKFPIWGTKNRYHIDTNCYFLKKEIAIQLSPVWYRKGRVPGLMPPDQALCYELLKKFDKGCTNGKYTVNYRVRTDGKSVHPQFFIKGNAWTQQYYQQPYPWRSTNF